MSPERVAPVRRCLGAPAMRSALHTWAPPGNLLATRPGAMKLITAVGPSRPRAARPEPPRAQGQLVSEGRNFLRAVWEGGSHALA